MIMVTSSQELLTHPLVTALLDYKWRTFARYVYYPFYILYLTFLLFLTGYVVTTPPPYTIDKSNFGSVTGSSDCEKYYNQGNRQHTLANIGKYVVLVLSIINMLKESIQLIQGRWYYLTWENLLEVVMSVSSILFTLDIEVCQRESGYRTDWQWNFGTTAIFLAWIEVVLYIQKFPVFGIYVVMFKVILKTFIKLFAVFVFFIIAFGMGFYCLLQNQTPYESVWNSILRTAVMMIGEFDYNEIFHGTDDVHYWLTYVLFCTFVVIMSIIFMNLMVGLAVHDTQKIRDKAELKRIAMTVHMTLDVENILHKLLRLPCMPYELNRKIVPTTERKLRHSAVDAQPATKHMEQIQESQQNVLKKIEKVDDDWVRMEEQDASKSRFSEIQESQHNVLKKIEKVNDDVSRMGEKHDRFSENQIQVSQESQESQQKVLKKLKKIEKVNDDVARMEEMLKAIMKAQDIKLHSDET